MVRRKNAIWAIFYFQILTSHWQHVCLAGDPVMALCVIRACSGGAYCLCKPCDTIALISQMHSNDWTYLVQTKTCKMSLKQHSTEHVPTRNQHLKPPTIPFCRAWISILSQQICSSGHTVELALAVQTNIGKEQPEKRKRLFIFQTITVVLLNKYLLWNGKAFETTLVFHCDYLLVVWAAWHICLFWICL